MTVTRKQFFPDGIDLATFIEENKQHLNGKHMIYVVKSNIKSDVNIYKLGKTTTGIPRLLDYQHAYGIKKKKGTQSGAKLYYYEIVANREPGATGELLVNRKEKALKLAFLGAGGELDKTRGKERFFLTKHQLRQAIEELSSIWEIYQEDYHTGLVRRAEPREATTKSCRCEKVDDECVLRVSYEKDTDGAENNNRRIPRSRGKTTMGPKRKNKPKKIPRKFVVGENVVVEYPNKSYSGVIQKVTEKDALIYFEEDNTTARFTPSQYWMIQRT